MSGVWPSGSDTSSSCGADFPGCHTTAAVFLIVFDIVFAFVFEIVFDIVFIIVLTMLRQFSKLSHYTVVTTAKTLKNNALCHEEEEGEP